MKQKTNYLFSIFMIMGLFVFQLSGCKKEDKVQVPVLTTFSVTDIGSNTATCGGNITGDGGANVISRGVCWSTNQNPTIADNKSSDGTGIGRFGSSISGLNYGTTYYIRAYATNSAGTGYGNQVVAITSATFAVVTTKTVSDITKTTASSGGNISSDGGSAVTARGVCWSTSEYPTIFDTKTISGSGTGSFISSITGLDPGMTYYVRAYATNAIATAYGNQTTMTTLVELPTLTTSDVTINTFSTATSGGTITNDGGAIDGSHGVCWSSNHNPTTSDQKTTSTFLGLGTFVERLEGLSPNTTYYVRAYATNSAGTAYGTEKTFILYLNSPGNNINDVDGNVYHTVKIGTQVWMVENLKTTHYVNGMNIGIITDNSEWERQFGMGYCWYNNDISNKDTYGALYSHFELYYDNSFGGVCPSGWNESSDADWTTLMNYLGGESVAGGKMKEAGTAHWMTPNTGATNVSGFTSLPGGYRSRNGYFYNMGYHSYYWTGPRYQGFPDYTAWYRLLFYNLNSANKKYGDEIIGMSVRCVKD